MRLRRAALMTMRVKQPGSSADADRDVKLGFFEAWLGCPMAIKRGPGVM
jgi:hypothetical protein